MMFGIPDALIAERFCSLCGADTIVKALRDGATLNNTGKIKNRKRYRHGAKMRLALDEINRLCKPY